MVRQLTSITKSDKARTQGYKARHQGNRKLTRDVRRNNHMNNTRPRPARLTATLLDILTSAEKGRAFSLQNPVAHAWSERTRAHRASSRQRCAEASMTQLHGTLGNISNHDITIIKPKRGTILQALKTCKKCGRTAIFALNLAFFYCRSCDRFFT